ncbi:MAG: ribosomal RNA small subunit methyltransferase A [Chloroflexi bacterium]|nr:ribosomal RNA small subunit methyltransferase A [Chloroflexota bacterium]MCI0799409.1 ribosomal RNA small subunit methyltransferase A [Chloroflexota bacterium]
MSVSDPAPQRDRPRKALAQHFLADNRVVLRILAAAKLTPQDLVLEIGPGRGVLTRELVAQAAQVVAVEMDPQLADSLPARIGHPSNLTTVQGDARKIDIPSLLGVDKPYKLVANLPYYAANPIVRRFLETEPKPSLLVIMLQQEVAQAMVAHPGQMSLLSVATQFHAVASRVCTVPPRSFHPPPAVTSAVVRLDVRDRPAVDVRDEGIFFDVVRAGFSARRKQLHNALAQGLKADREAVARLLADADIDGMRRAQTLSLEEWARISEVWGEQSSLESPGLR